jgi:hypothetical protein
LDRFDMLHAESALPGDTDLHGFFLLANFSLNHTYFGNLRP